MGLRRAEWSTFLCFELYRSFQASLRSVLAFIPFFGVGLDFFAYQWEGFEVM